MRLRDAIQTVVDVIGQSGVALGIVLDRNLDDILEVLAAQIDRHFCLTDARVGRLPPLISPDAPAVDPGVRIAV